MARTAMTPEERRLLLNGAHEPKINPLDYSGTLAAALNYYNVEADSKKKRKYAESYAKKVLGLDVSSASDFLLNTIGAMCRLIDRGEPITDNDIAKTHDGLTKIAQGKVKVVSSVSEKIQVQESTKPKKSPEQIAEEIATPAIEDIEVAIDDLIMQKEAGGSDYNFKAISIQNQKAIKICIEHFEKRLATFIEARDSEDSYVRESYSHINKRKFKHLISFLEEAVTKFKQSVAVAKVRKPTIKKEKPAHVIVNKLKYLKKCDELNIESVKPETIVGAAEVVLFNTKYRRISVIRALENTTLSVKGSSIINMDPTKSFCKTMRKPQEQLQQFYKATKRNTQIAFDGINSVDRTASNRVTEETLIISTNK